MKNNTVDSIKLGVFVLAGMLLLVVTLYVIGKNKGLFNDSFELRTHFKAVNGLVAGNNVRFSGIDIGAVKNIAFLSDTVIEVTMNVETGMRKIIRQNAVANLGTDGLVGNKVVNIFPARGDAPLVKSGDLLASKEEISTDAMLQTLHHTNENVAAIVEELRSTVHRISTGKQLSQLIEDYSLTANLKASMAHLHETTEKASNLMTDASETLHLASRGKGTVAAMLTDTSMAREITTAVQKIQTLENAAERLTHDLNKVVETIEQDISRGKGPVNVMLKDSVTADRLRNTLESVEQGAAAFNQNMEALKHNFFFRKYFKKQEKKEKAKNRGNQSSKSNISSTKG